MNEDNYSDRVKTLLKKKGIEIFDRIGVKYKTLHLEGILLPRPYVGDRDCLILKLDNGYNIGINIVNIDDIWLVKKARKKYLPEVPIKHPVPEDLPTVTIIGTGGTIASRIDYTTGAVYPTFSPEDIYSLVPELSGLARINVDLLFNIFSEDMNPKIWEKIAECVYKHIENGAEGIVIFHGTDTMGYTAAALSFVLQKLPYPVVLVGAQRSSDRPSSDTALNLISAFVTTLYAPFGEVVVVMHAESSDSYAHVHRGTRVRKCHTSRRDAFKSINSPPLAIVQGKEIKLLEKQYKPRVKRDEVEFVNGFDDKVALIKFYPGMNPEIIDFLIDRGYHGIVIEATGLGHVGKQLLKSIDRAIHENIPIAITSQCIWGRVNLNVYSRGIELLKLGVIPCEDMLPETAFVKLSWILDKTRDMQKVRYLMLKNIAYEISKRSEFR